MHVCMYVYTYTYIHTCIHIYRPDAERRIPRDGQAKGSDGRYFFFLGGGFVTNTHTHTHKHTHTHTAVTTKHSTRLRIRLAAASRRESAPVYVC
jgi:hypothetical protein